MPWQEVDPLGRNHTMLLAKTAERAVMKSSNLSFFSNSLFKNTQFLPAAARLVNMCCWSRGRGGRLLAFWKPQFMSHLSEAFGHEDFPMILSGNPDFFVLMI